MAGLGTIAGNIALRWSAGLGIHRWFYKHSAPEPARDQVRLKPDGVFPMQEFLYLGEPVSPQRPNVNSPPIYRWDHVLYTGHI